MMFEQAPTSAIANKPDPDLSKPPRIAPSSSHTLSRGCYFLAPAPIARKIGPSPAQPTRRFRSYCTKLHPLRPDAHDRLANRAPRLHVGDGVRGGFQRKDLVYDRLDDALVDERAD